MTPLVETVDKIFSEDGSLSRLREFEYRPQQQAMAVAVAEALEARKHLIVEAPTGVGKSLAYLVPAILYARSQKRKAIITTHTKNLQEQLFRKDIAITREILGEKDVHAVVLKGRRNYLCTTRLKRALSSPGSLFNDDEQLQLQRIHAWAQDTLDGDRESLGFMPDMNVWEMVCSEKGTCSTALCGSGCFFQRTKERVRSANIVIMNHALFFTLMALQGTEEQFIFPNDFVIFDEAHTLEAVAGLGIGTNISRYQILTAIHKLYNSKTKKGLLSKYKKEMCSACEEAEDATTEFFETVRGVVLAQDPAAKEFRVRRSHFVDDSLTGALARLESSAGKLKQHLKHEGEKSEIESALLAINEMRMLVDHFLEQTESRFTYWVELVRGKTGNVTLCGAPSDVAEHLGPILFRDGTSVIMTSATLGVNASLDYFQRRIGGVGINGLILDSPFNHHAQMRLCIPKEIPEPDNELFADALPDYILQSVDRSGGKALVLFTSNVLMQAVARRLEPEFAQRGLTLLVQGIDQQRHMMLQQFKRDINSVLFGLDSFWQGVDVPGEALEHVIITRLPFSVPNHPLIEAKLETIAQRGGNSFMEYTLPEAVLKLRQGVGRLLRSTSDKGIVTILDSRILKKRYGKIFLASLPQCPVEIMADDGEVEYVTPEV